MCAPDFHFKLYQLVVTWLPCVSVIYIFSFSLQRWLDGQPSLCCHLLLCIKLCFQCLRQALSLGQAALELLLESLLLVDLHREVRDLHLGVRGFLLGLLEHFLQRAYDLLLLDLMLPALLKKCLLEGSLVVLLERTDLHGVRLIERLDLRGHSPLCGAW